MKNLTDFGLLLALNGGSSSIKFVLFDSSMAKERVFHGELEGIGQERGSITTQSADAGAQTRSVVFRDHDSAVVALADLLESIISHRRLLGIGHRIVHGGPKYWKPQRLVPSLLHQLKKLSPFAPEHLPEELFLAETFLKRFPKVPQFACFDTAFHHDIPMVAQVLPIPRRYHAQGVRRYGFHGLSCEYLLRELKILAGRQAASGRVIIAHLGNGASVTAVRRGRSIDTSMSFTPTAGLPMGTRSGDLDPSIAWYLLQTEKMTPREFNHMVVHESGLAGISGVTSDMRTLLRREKYDRHAKLAIELFCYQARKTICAMAAALGGVDTLVFSGGIGEHNPLIRRRICEQLGFLSIKLDRTKNAVNGHIISKARMAVTVRVIPTDEELMIAHHVKQLLAAKKRA